MKTKTEKSPRKKPEAEHVHGPHCNHEHSDFWEFQIRLYKPEDYKALVKMWKAGNIHMDDSDSAKAIADSLKRFRESMRIFIAEAQLVGAHDKKPIGSPKLVGAVIFTYDGRRAFVYHFAVHPDFRGVGLGRVLLETCEEQAKMWGAKHLRLIAIADKTREAAHRLYQRSGWTADKNVWWYRKDL